MFYYFLVFIIGGFLGYFLRGLQRIPLPGVSQEQHSYILNIATEAQNQVEELQKQILNLSVSHAEQLTAAKSELASASEKLAYLNDAKAAMTDSFKALASEVLSTNSQQLINQNKEVLEKFHFSAKSELDSKAKVIEDFTKPIKDSLEKVDSKIQDLEKTRLSDNTSLKEQISYLQDSNRSLQAEASNLANALKSPVVRGRWGEVQLKRVVELSGMSQYCDFAEQVQTTNGGLRPDLVVFMPNNRNLVIDSKVPLKAYMESIEALSDIERKNKMKEHSKQLKAHINQLGSKSYWEQLKDSPEFVILFLPGECFFSAALEEDPSLIDYGAEMNVMIATPTTLMSLLRAVASGWRNEQANKNVKEVAELGRNLFERVRTFTGYLADLKKGLDKSTESFNSLVGSFETRILPSVRKFKELGVGSGEDIEETKLIDKTTRTISHEL